MRFFLKILLKCLIVFIRLCQHQPTTFTFKLTCSETAPKLNPLSREVIFSHEVHFDKNLPICAFTSAKAFSQCVQQEVLQHGHLDPLIAKSKGLMSQNLAIH